MKATGSQYQKILVGCGLALVLTACGNQLGDLSDIKTSSSSEKSGSDTTNAIDVTNVLSSPKEMRKGDVLYVDLSSSGKGHISFDGVPSDAKFDLLIGTAAVGKGAYTIRLANDESALDLAADEPVADQEIDEPPPRAPDAAS